MSAQYETAFSNRTVNRGVCVRDVLVAKAIRSGYNPYCRSTDTNARKITEEMRRSAQNVFIPEDRPLPAEKTKKPAIREVVPETHREVSARREVLSIENFELVKRKSPAISFGMLASVFVCGLVLAMIVYSGSLINEETRRYTELTENLETLAEESKTLSLELEEKNDLVVIEDIAKNDLGMIKVAEAAQKYITLSDENAINTYTSGEDETSLGVSMLNAFGEKISGILEYLD